MIIEEAAIKSFRNITELCFSPCEGINIIFGENAQGKTNMLEALWLFTGYKSFRTVRDCELISFGAPLSRLSMTYTTRVRSFKCEIAIDDKRHAKQNGVELKSASELVGGFLAVIFSPVHLSLIKDGPSERRKFLDIAICRLSPGYSEALKKYRYALNERNSLLKDVQYHSELYDTLEIWEQQLAVHGARIIDNRIRYVNKLSQQAGTVYNGLCAGKEEFCAVYAPEKLSLPDFAQRKEIAFSLLAQLKADRKNDILLKTTTSGPHRDDLSVRLNGKSVRSYGSQGQQRSAALALKLGEAQVTEEVSGEKPVILLDDVMSELDVNRQDYILNKINGYQVFITCCEPSQALRACTGKSFNIQNGGII